MKTATKRYETMVAHRFARYIPALAWTGLSIRLEIEAKTAGFRQQKLIDRAADCRERADRARVQ